MEPDPNVQAIIASFSALSSKQARQAVYRGILDQLVLDEWREVKSRLNPQIFQRDLVGTLPLEIVALVVEYWELVDVVLCRRVSKRWQEVLSSSIVCRAAYRASTGNDVSSISSPRQLTKLLERRIRQECGRPIIAADFKSTLFISPSLESNLVFNDGVLAWPEEETECTSIGTINLWTGKQDRLMTENRDRLLLVRVSKGFLAAITIRGYCHVWNLDSHEIKSFRLPSTDPTYHFLINGTKVVIGFESYLVHWCFNSEVTRQIDIGCKAQLVALHAPENQITVASWEKKSFRDKFDQTSNLRLHVQKFSIHDSGAVSRVLSRYQNISLGNHFVMRHVALGQMKFGGCQSTTLFEYVDEDTDQKGLCFCSLEPGENTIGLNLLPSALFSLPMFPVDNYLAYSRSTETEGTCILKSILWKPGVHRYSMCGSGPREGNCSMCADSDFVVLLGQNRLQIWAFDEKWVPPKVPGLVFWSSDRET